VQDVDEYVWAPGYERLVDYLASQPANVSQITAAELRFGSTGRVRCISNNSVLHLIYIATAFR